MTTYIRVQKDKYDLDVVIDVSNNQLFVETSGLEWIEITGNPTPGDYYYQGKFIADHDGEYTTIQQVIHQLEEERKTAEGIVTGEPQPEGVVNQEEDAQEEPNPVMPVEQRWVAPPPPLASADPLPHDLLEPVQKSARDFPKPIVPALDEDRTLEPSTAEKLNEWQERNRNLKKLIGRLQSGTGFSIDSEYKITFTPPLEYEDPLGDGTFEQSSSIMVDDTIEEYLDYLLKMDEMHVRLISRITSEL
jgi:hypothetical protein